MKRTLIIIACLILTGCNSSHTKPFTIVGKSEYDPKQSIFTYEDALGVSKQFIDKSELYHIGDTIK